MLFCLAFVPTRNVDMLEMLQRQEYPLFFPALASSYEDLVRR